MCVSVLPACIRQAGQIQIFYSALIEDYLGTYQVYGTKKSEIDQATCVDKQCLYLG